jgi:energy-converting hydrogenase Eha subunit F
MLGKITSYLAKVNPILDTQASVLGTFPRHPTLIVDELLTHIWKNVTGRVGLRSLMLAVVRWWLKPSYPTTQKALSTGRENLARFS